MNIRPIRIIGPISLIILLSLRLLLFYYHQPKYPDGTKIRITSKIASEPIIYSNSQYLKLSGFKTYLPLYPRLFYGDNVVIEGLVEKDKLKSPKLISNMAGNVFLYSYRQKLISFYERSLPKNHSALIAGIVIGSKSGIGEELWNNLKNSGTAHVVVASGMNITMVSQFLMSILIIFLPRRKAIPMALFGIWTYALISGFDAPIVRASVMGSLAYFAQVAGRMYQSLRILLLSCAIMIFIKPLWLADLGFWLSALATMSIIIFYPKVKKFFSFVPKILNENWSTTLSAQIGVVPLLYYYFGQFNILSPIINVAVLWTIVPITVIGMIAGITGTIFEPLGRLILYLCYPLTVWFLWVVSVFV